MHKAGMIDSIDPACYQRDDDTVTPGAAFPDLVRRRMQTVYDASCWPQ
jgi:hypothetical protein